MLYVLLRRQHGRWRSELTVTTHSVALAPGVLDAPALMMEAMKARKLMGLGFNNRIFVG